MKVLKNMQLLIKMKYFRIDELCFVRSLVVILFLCKIYYTKNALNLVLYQLYLQ